MRLIARPAQILFALVSAFSIAGAVHLAAQAPVPGANVNMVRSPNDPYLQRQIEGSIAVGTRNPCHMMGAGIDYRLTVDPGTSTETLDANLQATGDAWVTVFTSLDCGQRWHSRLIYGWPADQSGKNLNLKGYPASADPIVRAGTNGMFYYLGMVFFRGDHVQSKIFLQRFIDNNDKELGNTIQDLGAVDVHQGVEGTFLDKPWLAVDIPRKGFGAQAASWITDETGSYVNPNTGQTTATADTSVCDVNGQRFPAGNVYAGFARFDGPGIPNASKIMFGRSTDCGKTFDVKPVSTSQRTSQGVTIAIAPNDGTVYLGWREIGKNGAPHAIWVMTSTDGGKTFGKPLAIATPIDPFDQVGTRTTYRTNAMPAMTVLASGQAVIAWSERGFAKNGTTLNPSRDARIVFMMSNDRGKTWSPRRPIDDDPARPLGSHQMFPAVAFAAGKLTFSFLDFRQDPCVLDATKAATPECGAVLTNGTYVPARTFVDGIQHTGDVRAAQIAAPLPMPLTATTPLAFQYVQVSKYRTGFLPNGTPASESFHVNLPIFAQGSKSGVGDYHDMGALASIPIRCSDTAQEWVANSGNLQSCSVANSTNTTVAPMTNYAVVPTFHPIWTDLRNLIPPPDGDWARYTPPNIAQGDQVFRDPTAPACNNPAYAGTRNADLYTSRLTPGMFAGIVGNTKNLGFRKDVPGEHLQRAFVMFVQNTTDRNAQGVVGRERFYRLRIVNQPGTAATDRASFAQFPAPPYAAAGSGDVKHDPAIPPLTEIFIKVSPISTGSRTIFVTSANQKAQVRIDVDEADGLQVPGGPTPGLVPGGQRASLMINPDLTNPPITQPILPDEIIVPDIADEEVHTPIISDLNFFDINNPKTFTHDVQTPADQNPADQNPADQNPADQNPADQNPADQNPADQNPADQNPADQNSATLAPDTDGAGNPIDLQNATVRDLPFHFKNTGNTISRFRFSPVVGGDRTGLVFQALVVVRNNTLNVNADCNLVTKPDNQVVVNIANFNPRSPADQNPADQNPADQNPADQNSAYFFLAPGDEGTAFLRVYDTKKTDTVPPPTPETQVAAVLAADAANTGETLVQTSIVGPDLLVDPNTPITVTRAAVSAGNTTTINLALLNRGTRTAQAFVNANSNTATIKTRFYLSSNNDRVKTPGDLPAGEFAGFASLPACSDNEGACLAPIQHLLTLPQSALPGNYFIKIIVDEPEQVFEADDFNNSASIPFTILPFTLQYGQQPSDTTQGWTMDPPVTVALIDKPDNNIATYLNTSAGAPQVSLTIGANPGGSTLVATSPRPTVAGIATFDDISLNNVGTGYTLVAADSLGVRAVPAITSNTFNIEIDPPPTANPDSYSVNEDQALGVNANQGVTNNDTDTGPPAPKGKRPAGQLPLRVAAAYTGTRTTAQGGTVTVNTDGSFSYTPLANFFGSDTFQYAAFDGVSAGNVTTVTIVVNPVNDAPSFTKGADQTVLEDAGAQSVAWAQNISAGPTNETNGACGNTTVCSQTVSFTVTNNTNTGLFASGPAISPSGTLTYTPAANANGSATITVRAQDTGGTANGGVDVSPTQTFIITVTPVNDVPSFTKGADQTVLEDAGAKTVNGWATGISAGPANESSQTVNFIVSNDNNGLFSSQPSIAANGTLSYTPAANANGAATVTVQLHDDGGITNGGVDTSAAQTFLITVTAVNDAPSFTKGGDQTVNSAAGSQSVPNWATAISAGPANESSQTVNFIVSNNNTTLFTGNEQPAVSANGTLTYRPVAGAYGTATVTVALHDDGGGTPPNVDTSAAQTFTITVQTTTFVVTNTNNSGAGSLRQAITDSNANDTGVQNHINFNIPGGEPIQIIPTSALPAVTAPVIIDGTTQPEFATVNRPVVVVNGGSIQAQTGLTITGGNTVVRALAINGFTNGKGIVVSGAGGNIIQGNRIGTGRTGQVAQPNRYGIDITAPNTIVGGATAADRNLISGNSIAGINVGNVTGTQILGNYIGTNADGDTAIANGTGIALGGSNGSVGAAGAGNLISGNSSYAINLGGTNYDIAANTIGLNAAATAALANGFGIGVSGANNRIGTGGGNVISGNSAFGIHLDVGGNANEVKNNLIGTNAAAAALGNGAEGVRITANNNTVLGNTIVNNVGRGIHVVSGTGNSLRQNVINSNGFGIDLGATGPTANDTDDPDSGANNLQNFPVITKALTSGNVITVQGTLNSTPSSTFTVDFYVTPSCDASGYGQGSQWLGQLTPVTDSGGDAAFAANFPTPAPTGAVVTATATDASGNTSEFSLCATLTANTAPTASNVSASTAQNQAVATTLNGSDPDGFPVTYAHGNAAHGSIAGSGANLTYTPNTNFAGIDQFTYTANDGVLTSAPGTVSIDVAAPPSFMTTLGGFQTDTAYSVARTIDGGYVFAADTTSFDSPTNRRGIWVVKLDGAGNVLWQRRLTNPNGHLGGAQLPRTTGGSGFYQFGVGIAALADGGFAVAGAAISSSGPNQPFIAKLNSGGSLVWQQTIASASHDAFTAVIQDAASGDVIAAGSTQSATQAGSHDPWIVRFNSVNGTPSGKHVYGVGSDDDFVYAMTATGDGGFALTGWSYSTDAQGSKWVLKAASDNSVEWTTDLGATGSAFDKAQGIVQTAGGGYIIVGQEFGVAQALALNADGTTVAWNKQYDTAISQLNGVTLLPGGDVVAVGQRITSSIARFTMMRLDAATGGVVWSNYYTSADGFGAAVVPTSDGGVLAIGRGPNASANGDVLVVKALAADGSVDSCSAVSSFSITPTNSSAAPQSLAAGHSASAGGNGASVGATIAATDAGTTVTLLCPAGGFNDDDVDLTGDADSVVARGVVVAADATVNRQPAPRQWIGPVCVATGPQPNAPDALNDLVTRFTTTATPTAAFEPPPDLR